MGCFIIIEYPGAIASVTGKAKNPWGSFLCSWRRKCSRSLWMGVLSFSAEFIKRKQGNKVKQQDFVSLIRRLHIHLCVELPSIWSPNKNWELGHSSQHRQVGKGIHRGSQNLSGSSSSGVVKSTVKGRHSKEKNHQPDWGGMNISFVSHHDHMVTDASISFPDDLCSNTQTPWFLSMWEKTFLSKHRTPGLLHKRAGSQEIQEPGLRLQMKCQSWQELPRSETYQRPQASNMPSWGHLK